MMMALFCVVSLPLRGQSDTLRTEFRVDFRVGSYTVDPSFGDNARTLSRIVEFLETVSGDELLGISAVSFCGTTSLEGSYQQNRALGRKRLASLEEIIRSRVSIPDSLVARDDFYIPWAELRERIMSDAELPQREEVLAVIADETGGMVPYAGGKTIDARIPVLKALDGGRVWTRLNRDYFSSMRSASAVVLTYRRAPLAQVELPQEALPEEPAPEPEFEQAETVSVEPFVPVVPAAENPAPVPEPKPEPVRRAYVKTNAVGWALLSANIAGELDLCEHLSLVLPLYYCRINYFSTTLKFRNLSVQPELRWWPSPANEGFYAGLHLGTGLYNFAFGGERRYQDHDGRTPAFGGGLGAGYRMALGTTGRWWVDFSAGAGVYGLHYDLFVNKPGGAKVGSEHRTVLALDQLSVSFAYSFDLRKKGGAR